ncbi:glycosylhydrolase-like jelly roll fold domain-containing protein [Actinopolymorpha pittospori]
MPRQSRHRELFQGFAMPAPEFSPAPIWWWSGDRVELPRLSWQLDQLVDQGVHNLVVLNLAPTGPTYGSLADDPPLFSEEWWELWVGLCEHARKRGVRLWFYDQIGFSGANLQGQLVTREPEYAGASLERVVVDLDGPGELDCPAAGTPIAAAALPLSGDGAVAGPPVAVELSGRRVVWAGSADPAGRYRLMLAYSLRQGFDYTSARACAALLDTVHGQFERRLGPYLGSVIAGSFQDELPNLPTWSPGFAAEFAARHDYRIEDRIAALWEDWGPDSERVRSDYQRVRGVLAEEAFFGPLHAWHERHGLVVGVDQQSPSRAGDPLGSTWQYADYPRTHRWFSAPGSDHHGEAKIHSSLAHHYGRPRTWIESFHSSGWGGTLEETFDWLMPWLLAGATLYNPHAVYYSTRGGWWEWAPPSTCWRQPYWPHYRYFADTVSRLCWLLTRGEHRCDVGVLFPSATVRAGTLLTSRSQPARRASRTYVEIVGRMVWFDAHPGVLDRAHRDFDVLDDDTVASAEVRGGGLHTRGESYRAVVVPSASVLEGATAAKLVDLCRQGGLLVVVGDRPVRAAEGSAEGTDAVRTLAAMVEEGAAVHVPTVEDLPAALESLGRGVDADGPALLRRVGDRNVLLVPAAPVGWATAQPMLAKGVNWFSGPREKGYDFDPSRYRSRVVVRIADGGRVSEVEQWDPLTGTTRAAPVRVVGEGADAGTAEVTVRFDQAPAAILVWREAPVRSGDPAGAATDPNPDVDPDPDSDPDPDPGLDRRTWEVTLDGAWTAQVLPTMDNRHGDFALPAAEGAFPVQQWRLRHRVDVDGTADHWEQADLDEAGWEDVLVGQGSFGWRTDPLAPADVPEPLPADHAGRLDGPLDGPRWHPLRYSLSHGIEKDPFQTRMLGPKGRVPEEFWHVDGVEPGQVVVLRTSLPAHEERDLTLAVAAGGRTQVWWNGVELGADRGGYLRLEPVRTRTGPNLLEVRVTAERKDALRGYWALTADAPAFARPEWLVPGDGSVRGTELLARGVLPLARDPGRAVLQLGTDGPARLVVNGQEVATQGAFEPYGGQTRVLPYDVTRHLATGDNIIEVRFTDIGKPLAVLVDALVEDVDGTETTFVTSASWTFARDGVTVPVGPRRTHAYDPRFALLRPRPHPLSAAAWLEPAAAGGGVLDVVPEARPGQSKPPEWFRLVAPPGATSASLPVAAGTVQAWVDGTPVAVTHGRIVFPPGDPRSPTSTHGPVTPPDGRRVLAVRVEPVDGRVAGALWNGPLVFECHEGPLALGPWADAGLGSHSGGVRYRRQVEVDAGRGDVVSGRAVLDLGSVRGTAEVTVNGSPAGVRIWSPYRFDLTGLLRPGRNDVEVSVFNTLAPYLDDASPTMAVFAGQRRSGLFGPVRLVVEREVPGDEMV